MLRFWTFSGQLDGRAHEVDERKRRGDQALGVMEQHLAKRCFFVADRYGLADIALYAYTHVADEGSFDLAPYPAIRRWLERVRSQVGHVPLEAARPA